MKRNNLVLAAAGIAACLGLPGAAAAADGPWLVRVGVHNIDPKSDNGSTVAGDVEVDSKAGLTFNVDYFLAPNWAIDVLASLPFEHDIRVGGAEVASAKHLPPTVSLQYHFNPEGRVRPFVGAGLNYTLFMSEHIDGADLELDDSFGLAAQAGVDFALGGPWTIGADVRWIDIETDVRVNGTDIGTVEIDPIAYGVTVGYRF